MNWSLSSGTMHMADEMRGDEGERALRSGATQGNREKPEGGGSWIPLREAVGRLIAVVRTQPWSALHDPPPDPPPEGAIPCSYWQEVATWAGEEEGHRVSVQGDRV